MQTHELIQKLKADIKRGIVALAFLEILLIGLLVKFAMSPLARTPNPPYRALKELVDATFWYCIPLLFIAFLILIVIFVRWLLWIDKAKRDTL